MIDTLTLYRHFREETGDPVAASNLTLAPPSCYSMSGGRKRRSRRPCCFGTGRHGAGNTVAVLIFVNGIKLAIVPVTKQGRPSRSQQSTTRSAHVHTLDSQEPQLPAK